MQSQLGRGLALAFVIGGLLNKFSGHEWVPFRSTDLYSQSPSSRSYRADWGSARYVLAVQNDGTPLWKNGDALESLPGIQVPDFSVGRRVILQTAQGSGDKLPADDRLVVSLKETIAHHPLTSGDNPNITFTTTWVTVAIHVNNTQLSWWDYATLRQPRVILSAYESWPQLQSTLDRKLWEPLKQHDSHYQESLLYWVLMSIPVLFLAFDMRPFGPSSKSAWEALFRPFSSPAALLFKRYFADVIVEWIALDGANNNLYKFQWKNAAPILLFFLTLVDTWGLQRRFHNKLAMTLSCAIKLAAIARVTIYVYNFEHTFRYSTAHLTMEAQWTLGNLMAQLLALFYGSQYYDTLEATFHKLVVSLHLYTAACTKLGENGLAWIDDRYIAQLAFRGHFGGGKFPLADMLLYMPALMRASGMAVVLVMEATAVFSWWNYGTCLRLWMTFMLVSTLTIGVPLAPQAAGPLEGVVRYMTQWGILAVGLVCMVALYYVKEIPLKSERKEKSTFEPHVVTWEKKPGHTQ